MDNVATRPPVTNKLASLLLPKASAFAVTLEEAEMLPNFSPRMFSGRVLLLCTISVVFSNSFQTLFFNFPCLFFCRKLLNKPFSVSFLLTKHKMLANIFTDC